MNSKLIGIIKALGPGILFAGAAIGASHLIQSTRAGASFGFALLPMVILSNLFKYPFFEFGQRYPNICNESLIDGYNKLGNWEVKVFFILNLFTSVISTCGVTIVTSALSISFLKLFNIDININLMTAIILISTILLLKIGQYNLLDKIVKILIFTLTIFTTIAFVVALINGNQIKPDFIEPHLWEMANVGFFISLMGWMPAPIEASVWQSLWALEREKATNYKPTLKETLIDFNIGYIITSVLAVFFVGLGALVMYGSGEVFSDSGIVFSSQVISLYVKTLGNWSLPIITVIALITMASTTLTVVDAYPRSLENCINIIFTKTKENKNVYWIIISLMSVFSFVILMIFTDKLKTMVDFATAISFLSAPIFGYLNYKLVTSDLMPEHAKPNMILKVLSWVGLIFLTLFSLFYIWSLIR